MLACSARVLVAQLLHRQTPTEIRGLEVPEGLMELQRALAVHTAVEGRQLLVAVRVEQFV